MALSLVSLSLMSFFKLPNIFLLELIDPFLNDLKLARGVFRDARYFWGPIGHDLVVDENWVIWGPNYEVRLRVVICGAVGNEILIDEDGIGLIVLGLHSQLVWGGRAQELGVGALALWVRTKLLLFIDEVSRLLAWYMSMGHAVWWRNQLYLLCFPLPDLLFELKHDLSWNLYQHFLIVMFWAERFLVVGMVFLLEALLWWTDFPDLPFDGFLFDPLWRSMWFWYLQGLI